ncbi:MAG: ABC transporter permease [Chloroflexota bacterium]
MLKSLAISQKKYEEVSRTRQIVLGVVFILIGILIHFAFTTKVDATQITTFGLNPGGQEKILPNWTLNSYYTLLGFSLACIVMGILQIFFGLKQWTNRILGILIGLFVFGFLVWGAAGKSLNLEGLLMTTIQRAVPITLGAFAGILCEKSGVVNIAIEGMMLGGALVATIVGSLTHNLYIGLIAGMLTGMSLAWLLAILSIKYKTNQIIAGTVINIFSIGLTSYISARFVQQYEFLNSPGTFPIWKIPLLSKIPIIGPVFFQNSIFVYAMLILMVVIHIALQKTRWGLRVRAVGEHPKAADTLGINVFKTRYMAVMLGGLIAGLAGAFFTLGSVGRFDKLMTSGKGFIGLAAMLFGNYTPAGSFGAGMLFGFADSLGTRLSILNVPIPADFLLMAPYIATMILLAGVVGKSTPPAADGLPYEKE